MEILKPILDIYDKKKDVLLFYLDKNTREKVNEYLYLNDYNELFLNDKIYCIDRSTLLLEHIGIINAIKGNKITIKVPGNYSKHINELSYYIFIKRRYNKKNDRDFYKALLNSIS